MGQVPVAAGLPEQPSIAPTVELLGELQGTGFTDRQWLIRRDGRFLQVTELIYRIAEHSIGERTVEEIATAVTASTDWVVTADNVRQLIETKLIPMGLILTAAGTVAPRAEGDGRSPLQIGMRVKVLSPRIIDPITSVLRLLYRPAVAVPLLLLIMAVYGWLYLVRGVGDSVRAALYMPGGLLLLMGLAVVSGIFHEFGHAAALRYGGGKVGRMGIGFYLALPTFFTDTTDSYRLGRWARLRTDLGGIYFHLIFGLALIALYLATRQEVLLAVVLVISLDILYQLVPYVRLDGYWALADLTGIPDFFSQMGPFLRSVLPGQRGIMASRLPQLKGWVKVAFSLYIIGTVPLLLLLAVVAVWGFPRYLAIGGEALMHQVTLLSLAQSVGDAVLTAAAASQLLLLALSLIAGVYFVYTLLRKPARSLWRWSTPTRPRRAVGALIATAAVALLVVLWAPEIAVARRSLPAGVQSFPVPSRNHVLTPVSYPQTPPVGGNHSPVWQNCGFYDTPIANEHGVHSLEHGAVWITYQPGLPRVQVDSLRRLARRTSYVLVSPYAGLPAPVVASAWGRQARLRSADDPLLHHFVRAFRLGAQAPERGGPCTYGIGQPK